MEEIRENANDSDDFTGEKRLKRDDFPLKKYKTEYLAPSQYWLPKSGLPSPDCSLALKIKQLIITGT